MTLLSLQQNSSDGNLYQQPPLHFFFPLRNLLQSGSLSTPSTGITLVPVTHAELLCPTEILWSPLTSLSSIWNNWSPASLWYSFHIWCPGPPIFSSVLFFHLGSPLVSYCCIFFPHFSVHRHATTYLLKTQLLLLLKPDSPEALSILDDANSILPVA